MSSNRYFLSTLRLEDVKEAKRNLPRWDGSETQFQTWHHAFLHLAYCLRVSDFLSGSAIFPESFMPDTLQNTSPLQNFATSPYLDSDSDNEETPIFPTQTKQAHMPMAPVACLSGSKLSVKDDDTLSIGSFSSNRGLLATFVNEDEYDTVAEHLSVLYSSLWTSIRESPSLVSLANTDRAIDNRNVILAYANIKSQYILSSGMGIMSVFSAFF